jgi:ABC-type dipeptide/oligopeptide/nickel transport system ATPase component
MTPKTSKTKGLQVRNLRVEIPTRRGVLVAIDDLSFDIAPGEVLGMVGESGAGKSITGSAIIGLHGAAGSRTVSASTRCAARTSAVSVDATSAACSRTR